MEHKYDYVSILEDTINFSRRRDYIGWDKHDGMSSRIRRVLPFENQWINLVFQEVIKRSPINLRQAFLVEKRPNPKGLALFAIANFNLYELLDNKIYKQESKSLLNRVISQDVDHVDGFCLSHNHSTQSLGQKTPNGTPNIVSTSYGVKALLKSNIFKDEFASIAHTSDRFVKSELCVQSRGDEMKVSYTPRAGSTAYTLNANALAARLYVDLYDTFGDEEYKKKAKYLLNYVANMQTDIGGWEYMDPASSSHLGMDNYHNGFIIESFLRYQEAIENNAFGETVMEGLEFYRKILYDVNGAPRWDESNTYPRDIHAAAQGIVVFTQVGDMDFASRIVDWAIANLYAGDGRFFYQKNKYYTKKITLMRWSQAWMAYALSEFLRYDD